MPRKTRRNKRTKTRKQKVYKMVGCSACKYCKCKGKCICKPKCSCNCHKYQKAGMGCGPQGCPIAPYPMNGGNCDVMGCGRILGSYQNGGACLSSMCSQIPVTSRGGGEFYKPPPPMPGPFIGEPIGPLVTENPGVDGISSNRNYYDLNLYKNDPQTMMLIRGGKRKQKTHKRQKGGTFIPQELVNLGRDFTFNLKSAYNTLNSIPVGPSPLPYKDQLK